MPGHLRHAGVALLVLAGAGAVWIAYDAWVRPGTDSTRTTVLSADLPVAFDTTGMRKYTQSGWARFNKDENLATLERSMTPEPEARARSERYLQLSTGAARQTIVELVTQWLLHEQHWKRDPEYTVKVHFPGEP